VRYDSFTGQTTSEHAGATTDTGEDTDDSVTPSERVARKLLEKPPGPAGGRAWVDDLPDTQGSADRTPATPS
jgi:hypothetical protein